MIGLRAWLIASYTLLYAGGCAQSETGTDRFRDPVQTRDAGSDEDARAGEAPIGELPSAPDAGNTQAAHDAGALADGATSDAGSDAPVCPLPAFQPGSSSTVQLMHGGVERSYLLHVGRGLDMSSPARLIVNFHGLNNSPGIQVLFSGMNALADERGFLVVYPQGLNSSFNAGGCCGASASNAVDDLGFVRAIVADLSSKACIDPRRVYATGFSNGGFMSHHVGCRAADLFAAIAPIAGANATVPCAPSRPLPVFAINASTDPVVRFGDGEAGAQGWVERNGCTGEPVREMFGRSYCDTWSSCQAGAEVRFCTWTGGTHLWPGSSSGVPASPMLLDFFERFTLP